MTTFTINAFSINSHANIMEFDPSKWSDAFVQSMIEQGVKVRVDRSSASLTIEKGFGEMDRLIKAQEVAKGLAEGKIPAGGGFSRLSPEVFAMKETLRVNKVKIKTGESMPQCLMRLAKALTSIPEGEENATEAAIVETRDALKTELQGSDVYKTTLQARLSKTKVARAGSLLSKLK